MGLNQVGSCHHGPDSGARPNYRVQVINLFKRDNKFVGANAENFDDNEEAIKRIDCVHVHG